MPRSLKSFSPNGYQSWATLDSGDFRQVLLDEALEVGMTGLPVACHPLHALLLQERLGDAHERHAAIQAIAEGVGDAARGGGVVAR
jgi:hypothetical protein